MIYWDLNKIKLPIYLIIFLQINNPRPIPFELTSTELPKVLYSYPIYFRLIKINLLILFDSITKISYLEENLLVKLFNSDINKCVLTKLDCIAQEVDNNLLKSILILVHLQILNNFKISYYDIFSFNNILK